MSDVPKRAAKVNDLIPVKSTESWSILLSKKERCVYINIDDYHAGPLRLTRDQLYELGRMMSKKNGKDGKNYRCSSGAN